jgi:crossover junction endodeoxyribonuclease RusA
MQTAEKVIELRIHGLPAPQGSKAFKGMNNAGRAILRESSKNVGPWREAICWQSREQYKGEPLEGDLKISIDFWLPRPKSHYRIIDGELSNQIKPGKPIYCQAATKGDVDKLLRSTFDGLAAKTGGCVAQDDRQFVKLKEIGKYYVSETEGPGAWIKVVKL